MRTTLIAVLLLVLASAGHAADIAEMSVQDIRDCVEQAGPKHSSIQSAVLRTEDGEKVSESEVKLYWKKFDDGLSRALIRFHEPPDLRGSALLVIQNADGADGDIFMYVPEFRKVRRITSGMMSGSMFGTDFTYEEFERFYGLAETAKSSRLPDTEVEGRVSFAIESMLEDDAASAYSRVVQHIEQERCIPLKTEFFTKSEEPVKVLSVDADGMRQFGSVWLPQKVVMRDIKEGSHTTLTIRDSEVDGEIPDRTFSQRSLARGR